MPPRHPGRDSAPHDPTAPDAADPSAVDDLPGDVLEDTDELDDELDNLDGDDVVDRAAPSEHQLAGGAPRGLGILLVVAGLAGLWASIELVLSEIIIAKDPSASLACDLNPIIGCGSFITTWQAHALGIPNAVIGVGAFGGLFAVGLMFLSGARAGRWFWRVLVAGVVFATVAQAFFLYTAFFVIHGLCPYCLVVWTVNIPVIVHVLARAAQAGHIRLGRRLTRALVMDRWIVVGVLYAAIVIFALVHFWDQWMLLAR
jgi:uncharacterized membrane protein